MVDAHNKRGKTATPPMKLNFFFFAIWKENWEENRAVHSSLLSFERKQFLKSRNSTSATPERMSLPSLESASSQESESISRIYFRPIRGWAIQNEYSSTTFYSYPRASYKIYWFLEQRIVHNPGPKLQITITISGTPLHENWKTSYPVAFAHVDNRLSWYGVRQPYAKIFFCIPYHL